MKKEPAALNLTDRSVSISVMPRAAHVSEAERRLALLKAAFREVSEKGFSEVTLDDIAKRAGVSKGITLYYFDSKEDLYRQLFVWLIDSIHARMREAVAVEKEPVAKVRALVALIFPSPSKNRAFFRAFVDFCGLAARRDGFREINERFYAGCREIDAGIVEEGMRQGVFLVRDRLEAGSTMRAIFDGLMMQWLSEKDPDAAFAGYRERCEREILQYLTGRAPETGRAPRGREER
jgi:AcrR family transcriptional regulator